MGIETLKSELADAWHRFELAGIEEDSWAQAKISQEIDSLEAQLAELTA